MIKILKQTLKISAVSLLTIIAASKVFAMEEEAQMQAARSAAAMTSPEQSSVQEVEARERFDLIRGHLKDPEFTKNTPVSTLPTLYARDLAFIKAAVSSHTNGEPMLGALKDLDALVKSQGLYARMSWDHYAKIASIWAEILSRDDFKGYTKKIGCFFVPFLGAYSSDDVVRIQREIGDYDIVEEFSFLDSCYPVIPHVSPTGAVPVRLLNEAYGFFRDLECSLPYSVDFVNVGTNEHLSFNGARKQNSARVFEYDVGHVVTANKTNAHPTLISAETLCRKAAHLKRILATAHPLFPEDEARRQLAIFNIFHMGEGRFLRAVTAGSFAQYVTAEIMTLRQRMDEKDGELSDYDRLSYETKIVTAQSLKLPITGETFPDRVSSYYAHLIEGYEALLPFADVFDKF